MIGENLTKETVKIINRRGKNYGNIKENHDLCAVGINAITQYAIRKYGKVSNYHFALIMIWVKIVRLLTKPKHKDSIKDIIGYAITYSECVRGK
tara:strand:- start:285 stop:566 length:282 start_codon:yes stop_codon:yes gene_type:complete